MGTSTVYKGGCADGAGFAATAAGSAASSAAAKCTAANNSDAVATGWMKLLCDLPAGC